MASLLGFTITQEKLSKLKVGDTVYDMHYGLHGLERNLEKGIKIQNHVTFPCDKGSLFITETTGKMYCNKMAVVVKDMSLTPHGAVVTLAYSYDARTFGVFQLSTEERNVSDGS